jgi:hypothetical protein
MIGSRENKLVTGVQVPGGARDSIFMFLKAILDPLSFLTIGI